MDDKDLKAEMWLAARTLWENTPDITDSDIMASLQPHYGDLVPTSNGTFSKKRSKEKWAKKNPVKPQPIPRKRVAKKSPKMENETAISRGKWKNSAGEMTIFPSGANKVDEVEKSLTLENVTSGFEEILGSIVMGAKERGLMIVKHRKRWQTQGMINDKLTKLALSLLDDLESVSESAEIAEKMAEMVQKKIAVINILGNTLDVTTRAAKTISEVELPLCGITPDDFQQSAQEVRTNALAKFGNIDEEEREARERLKAELHERLSRIESRAASPDFGRSEDNPPLASAEDIDFVNADD